MKAKAERDLGRLRDQLQLTHQALGEASLEEVERGGYGMDKRKERFKALCLCDTCLNKWSKSDLSNSLNEIIRRCMFGRFDEHI